MTEKRNYTKVRTFSYISTCNLKVSNIFFYLGATLTVAEKSETGSVKSYTYHTYIQATGGYLVAIIVFLTFFLNVGSSAFSTWWLAVWIKAGGGVSNFISYPIFKTYIYIFFFFNQEIF